MVKYDQENWTQCSIIGITVADKLWMRVENLWRRESVTFFYFMLDFNISYDYNLFKAEIDSKITLTIVKGL